MAHPHNPNWPDDYKPTATEVHMNFARLIADAINTDIIVDADSFVCTSDILDQCATYGIALSPDFNGIAGDAYMQAFARSLTTMESLVPGSTGGG